MARRRVSRKVILRDRLAQVIIDAEDVRKATEGKKLLLKVRIRLFDGSGQAGRAGKDLGKNSLTSERLEKQMNIRYSSRYSSVWIRELYHSIRNMINAPGYDVCNIG